MKTTGSDKWQVTGDTIKGGTCEVHSCHASRVTCHPFAFTLIGLLTVIAIIAALSAFLFPVLKGVKHQQYIRNATAEMEQLETAITRYHDAFGFYPPDTQLNPGGSPLMNQLYFELMGTTNVDVNNPAYQSLDDPSLPPLTKANVQAVFGVSGFLNCSKPGSSEDAPKAQNFLPGLRPTQTIVYTNLASPINPVKLIITSVGGPDITYQPLGPGAIGINPWRYNSSNPTNNPGGYDLWIQLSISGKTNLICNWNKQVQLNSPLP